jgi:hypothetical protein
MKFSILSIIYALILFTCSGVTNIASAGIIAGEQLTAGGKSVNLQGLEWLSLDHTLGIETVDLASGFTDNYGTFIVDQGWRYATIEEASLLMNSLWMIENGGWRPGDLDGRGWYIQNFGPESPNFTFWNPDADDAVWTTLEGWWRAEVQSVNWYMCALRAHCAGDRDRGFELNPAPDEGVYEYLRATGEDYVVEQLIRPTHTTYTGELIWPAGNYNNPFIEPDPIEYEAELLRVHNSTGHLLVRATEVTEPSQCAIFALGLTGLLWRRFKNHC